jgi:hypothetical protein
MRGWGLGLLTTLPLQIIQHSLSSNSEENKPEAWRLFLDVSFPTGHSVNVGILKNEFPVVYSTVPDAIRMIVILFGSELNTITMTAGSPDDKLLESR